MYVFRKVLLEEGEANHKNSKLRMEKRDDCIISYCEFISGDIFEFITFETSLQRSKPNFCEI